MTTPPNPPLDKKQARAQAAGQKATRKAQRPWVARHKILTALGVFILIGIIIVIANSGGSQNNTASTPSTTSTAASGASAAAAPEAASGVGLNTPARDGKFEFTVTKVQSGVPSVGPEGLAQKAQGQFILLTMTVKNVGDQAQLFDASSQKLRDGSKRTYDADSTASIAADSGGSSTFLQDINPGNQVSGVVVFDVPPTVVPTQAELHDSPFSDGVKVRLK